MSDNHGDMVAAVAYVLGEIEKTYHRQSRWLYLPHDERWINGDQIVMVMGGAAEDDGPITMYAIVAANFPHDQYDVEHPDDVAAVTAWLEGRL